MVIAEPVSHTEWFEWGFTKVAESTDIVTKGVRTAQDTAEAADGSETRRPRPR